MHGTTSQQEYSLKGGGDVYWSLFFCIFFYQTKQTDCIYLALSQLRIYFLRGKLSEPFYAEKTSITFPFKLDGIWSWWQFSFRFWSKLNSIWFNETGFSKYLSVPTSCSVPWAPIQAAQRANTQIQYESCHITPNFEYNYTFNWAISFSFWTKPNSPFYFKAKEISVLL